MSKIFQGCVTFNTFKQQVSAGVRSLYQSITTISNCRWKRRLNWIPVFTTLLRIKMTVHLYQKGLPVSVKPTGEKNNFRDKNVFQIKFSDVTTQRKHHRISTSPLIPTCHWCFWHSQLALSSVNTVIIWQNLYFKSNWSFVAHLCLIAVWIYSTVYPDK